MSRTSPGLSSTIKTSAVLDVFSMRPLLTISLGQREIKCRTLAGFRFDPDAAPVRLDDLLADGQPDAGAGVFFAGMQALEDLEDPLVVPRIDPDPIVVDGKKPLSVASFRRNVDGGRGLSPEFDRIADQILKQLHQLEFVAGHDSQPVARDR